MTPSAHQAPTNAATTPHEQHVDLIHRRETEAKIIATAHHRLGNRNAPAVSQEDRELADFVVKSGLTLCRYYEGVIDASDYPADPRGVVVNTVADILDRYGVGRRGNTVIGRAALEADLAGLMCDTGQAERVAKVLRHMADKMLHQTEVPDEALRSTIDGWAGALHGAADLLDAGGPTRYEPLPDLDKAGAESLGLTVRFEGVLLSPDTDGRDPVQHPVIANARVWLDEDGEHVWFAHDCTEGRIKTMLPHPQWQADPATGDVRPSIDCRTCGTHAYFNLMTDGPSAGTDQNNPWNVRDDT